MDVFIYSQPLLLDMLIRIASLAICRVLLYAFELLKSDVNTVVSRVLNNNMLIFSLLGKSEQFTITHLRRETAKYEFDTTA